ncbi:MAG: antitoxin Xre/MbcA/ParS toxin-binding domain-containing protein [Gemmatimonadaceae bacterium]
MTYPDINAVVGKLGGSGVLRAQVRTLPELSRVVREGLPLRSLYKVAERFPAAHQRRVEQLIAPRSTLQRREESGVLSAEESQRLERVARLVALAEQVWESEQTALDWLTAPHPHFDGEAPLDVGATELGARRVEELLWKLEHSLPV